jgi:hypothetical protein
MNVVTQRSELDMTGYNVGEDIAQQGELALRWRKMLYVSGKLKVTEYHRRVLNPGDDVAAVLADVEADLYQQGYPWDARVINLDKGIIGTLVEKIWTPEIVAARRAAVTKASATHSAATVAG